MSAWIRPAQAYYNTWRVTSADQRRKRRMELYAYWDGSLGGVGWMTGQERELAALPVEGVRALLAIIPPLGDPPTPLRWSKAKTSVSRMIDDNRHIIRRRADDTLTCTISAPHGRGVYPSTYFDPYLCAALLERPRVSRVSTIARRERDEHEPEHAPREGADSDAEDGDAAD